MGGASHAGGPRWTACECKGRSERVELAQRLQDATRQGGGGEAEGQLEEESAEVEGGEGGAGTGHAGADGGQRGQGAATGAAAGAAPAAGKGGAGRRWSRRRTRKRSTQRRRRRALDKSHVILHALLSPPSHSRQPHRQPSSILLLSRASPPLLPHRPPAQRAHSHPSCSLPPYWTSWPTGLVRQAVRSHSIPHHVSPSRPPPFQPLLPPPRVPQIMRRGEAGGEG